jgi:OOP family OmpA-OmpF porin
MRTRWVIILLMISRTVAGQNLVPNPGFESFYRCPFSFNVYPEDFYLPGWSSPSKGTPDHFHSCSRTDSSVPRNWAGVAEAHGGEGYVGIYVWGNNGKSYREYIQCKLIEPLQKDKVYRLGFYYKLSSYSKYKADRIGLLLLDSALSSTHDNVFALTPTLSVIQSPLETGEWDLAKMTYRAHGGEAYLIIGNFYDDHSTENMRLDSRTGKNAMLSNLCYYYIDDVSVIPAENAMEDSVFQTIEPERKTSETFALRNIQFEFDSYSLIPSYFPDLDRMVNILNDQPRWSIKLTGHTDDVGSEAYNFELSRNRASRVSEYLKLRGIDSGRISTLGLGKTRPLAKGTDENSRLINRRVEAQFVERRTEK